MCAFSNEPGLDGGWILLGVQRDDSSLFTSYAANGVANPDKVSADLASQCATTFNTSVRVDISTEQINGKTVIAVYVPEASPQDKPVSFKATGLPKGAYRRIGSTDQRCTDDDLEIFFQSRHAESFDAGTVLDASIDDFDEAAINDYPKSRADANPDAEELRWTDIELLEAIKAVRRTVQGDFKPTVAGILLFGKSFALRRSFPMTRVDYIRVPGREWVSQPDVRFESVELRGPLFSLLRRTQTSIIDDLPKAFGLDEGSLQRNDTPIIPLRALREAIVNALLHRTYRTNAPVQVIRYSNRLEIRNPGFSLKSPEHLGEPGSIPRNPVIAAVLNETRFAETKGSGIRAIREAMESSGLVPPLFESDRGQDIFVTQFLFHHFLGEDDLRWLSRFKDLHLNDEECRSLVVAREAGFIDNATYRAINKVDALAASSALRKLRDAGLLVQQGRASATYYIPTLKLIGDKSLDSKVEALSSKESELSSRPTQLSSELDSLSSKDNSQHSRKLEGARNSILDILPGQLAAKVGAVGRRHPPSEVQDLIVELCQYRAWRVDELSLILKRNAETIRQNYLRPLLSQKRIAMIMPNTPSSPLQAYTVAALTHSVSSE